MIHERKIIVENDLEMEKVYVYLPQVNCAFSNIFASILSRSPISRQRLVSHWREMAALAISLLKMTSKCSFTSSKLRFFEHFRLDLASLAYFAPATSYGLQGLDVYCGLKAPG